MLRIRKEQMERLSNIAKDRFSNRMVTFLKTEYPEEYANNEEKEIIQVVEYGMKKANSYGITTKKDICTFLQLMATFGLDFDQNERLPWASAILKNKSIIDGSIKTMLLDEAALTYLEETEVV